jgi:DNA-damage-inducible protein D
MSNSFSIVMKTDKEVLMKTELTMFESHNIRRVYDEETEVWWFSVVDIIQVLTQQPDYQTARKYWNKLKERLRTSQ